MWSPQPGERPREQMCRDDVILGDSEVDTHRASPSVSHPCAILGTSHVDRQPADLQRWVVVHNSQHLLLLSPEFQLHNKDVGKALQ
jgi:hypothetical protein